MEESILNSIKKLLGLDSEYNEFDTDIIIHINSVFSILNHMGIGPEDPFMITGDSEVWDDFLENKQYLEMVKSYVYLKVRIIFDPPNSGAATAFNNMIAEYEWRLYELEDRYKETN